MYSSAWEDELHKARVYEGIAQALRNGIDINAKDPENGWTKLYRTIINQDDIATEAFLNCGANVNETDIDGDTPLHIAILGENDKIVRMLLDSGASPSIQNNDGLTPFHVAVAEGYWHNAKILMQYGVDINEPNKEGFPALHLAVFHNEEKKALKLIKLGADVNARGLIKEGNKEVSFTPIYVAVAKGHYSLVKDLIKKKADVNIPVAGHTCLYYAIRDDLTDIALALIKAGADVKMPSGELKMTPLHIAAKKGNLKVVKALLDRGADVYALDGNGYTAFDVATAQGFTGVATLLEKTKAKVDKKNQEIQNNILAKQQKYVARSGEEISKRLMTQSGLKEAKQLFNGNFEPIARRLGQKEAVRVYVHIYKELTQKERETYKKGLSEGQKVATQKNILSAQQQHTR